MSAPITSTPASTPGPISDLTILDIPLNTPTDAQVAAFLNRATQLRDDILFADTIDTALTNGVVLNYSGLEKYFSPSSLTPATRVAQVPAIRLAAELNEQLSRRDLNVVMRSRRETLAEVCAVLDTWVDMFHGADKRYPRPKLEQVSVNGDLRLIELLVHSLTFRAPKG